MSEKEEKYTFENGEFKVNVKPSSWNVYVFEKDWADKAIVSFGPSMMKIIDGFFFAFKQGL